MKSFLAEVADYLITKQIHLPDSCMVFPNKRSALFLKAELANIIDKPILLPETLSINELFSAISEFQPGDPLFLLTELYKSYRQIQPKAETFDEFYPWGETLLADFDDTDKYLAEPSRLFRNISDLKEIDQLFGFPSTEEEQLIRTFWMNITGSRPSPEKENFSEFWNLLFPLYSAFTKRLIQLGTGYEGLICRIAIEKLKETHELLPRYSHYIFIGFNALNACEKWLFHYCRQKGNAYFFWDADRFYLNHPKHEAGLFLRENLKRFPAPQDFKVGSHFESNNRCIHLMAVSSSSGMAHAASGFLHSVYPEGNIHKDTAIVLADENDLMPVLQSLPSNIHEFNITMGYPVAESNIFGLISLIIDLRLNARIVHGSTFYYYKNVLSVLHHPLVYQANPDEIQQFIHSIKEQNLILIQEELLTKNDWSLGIFHKINSATSIYRYFLEILYSVYIKLEAQEPTKREWQLEKEILYKTYTSIQQIGDSLLQSGIEILAETFYRFIRASLKNLRIAFSGEPLAGLQILGLLETRSLDFNTVILFPANEGVLPKSSQAPSFIPNSLRYGFGLPTGEHQDAIFAYYFYRLLQRPEKIYILWNTGTNTQQSGKISRFLLQIRYENIFPIKEYHWALPAISTQTIPIEIKKDAPVLEKLHRYFSTRYISASALSEYMHCPLRFYFHYLAGLKTPDEISEEADSGIFGSLFHEAAYRLYEPFIEKAAVETFDLHSLLQSPTAIADAVEKSLRKFIYPSLPDSIPLKPQGSFIIVQDVLHKYLTQLLHTDLHRTPFSLVSMEKEYLRPINIPMGDHRILLQLGGKIDRLELSGNEIRIIDYKTGRKKNRMDSVESLFEKSGDKRPDAVFQACFYAYLLSHEIMDKRLQPQLFFLRSMFDEDQDPRIEKKSAEKKEGKIYLDDFREIMDEFDVKLHHLLMEINHPDISFSQSPHLEDCKFCPYKEICRK